MRIMVTSGMTFDAEPAAGRGDRIVLGPIVFGAELAVRTVCGDDCAGCNLCRGGDSSLDSLAELIAEVAGDY